MAKIYGNDWSSTVERAQDPTTKAKNKAQETANRASEKLAEVQSAVEDKLDKARAATAEGLHGAASALSEKANDLPGGEGAARLAYRTAYRTQATANYICQHNLREMMTDVKACIRRHPGQAFLTAAISGFLIGRALMSKD